ncbi:Uncharacterised protein [Acinetobacter baumannii]|nr:Uncharacterised protein [Acinetobacter baumannii]SSS48323.1 Uncharacterised protein [Acinetobacter baumannii]
MIISGAISVLNGWLPAMKITEPYSPTPRANAKAKPVNRAGSNIGKIILVMVCQRFAPSAEAASSSSVSISLNTG